MESYLIISNLNDFIFCPKSIYFHSLYQKYSSRVYKEIPQVKGTINHEAIEQKKYSSSTKIIQSLPIYHEGYNLCGKIDLYDREEKILIERKTKIKKIYDGYRYQLYAQYFCLIEMGYSVKKMVIRSLEDNQNYWIEIPKQKEKQEFENLLRQMKNFKIENQDFKQNPKKCQQCIYSHLCDVSVIKNN